MPYALIPEGFTLKKVTKAQEDAVKDHRRHEDVKTFLGNETTPLLMGGVTLLGILGVGVKRVVLLGENWLILVHALVFFHEIVALKFNFLFALLAYLFLI